MCSIDGEEGQAEINLNCGQLRSEPKDGYGRSLRLGVRQPSI